MLCCAACGKLAREGARFCDNCGTSLAERVGSPGARTVAARSRRPDYAALGAHLRQKGAVPEVRMAFSEVAAVVGAPLPPSAVRHRAWWGNEDPEVTMHAHKRAWGRAGYRVAEVHQHATDGWVRFERVGH